MYRYNKKVWRSMNAHERCAKKINKIMNEKNGFYKKGEYECLEKKRIYHNTCLNYMSSHNKLLNISQKRNIYKNINIKTY